MFDFFLEHFTYFVDVVAHAADNPDRSKGDEEDGNIEYPDNHRVVVSEFLDRKHGFLPYMEERMDDMVVRRHGRNLYCIFIAINLTQVSSNDYPRSKS